MKITNVNKDATYRKLIDDGRIQEWKPYFYWQDRPNSVNLLRVDSFFIVKFYADGRQFASARKVSLKESFTKHRTIEIDYYLKFTRRSKLVRRLPSKWLRAIAVKLLLAA